jgi:hypothetical protein
MCVYQRPKTEHCIRALTNILFWFARVLGDGLGQFCVVYSYNEAELGE